MVVAFSAILIGVSLELTAKKRKKGRKALQIADKVLALRSGL
jgi:hypothetical protein